MAPFSESQIDGYITEYVSLHQPLWGAKDYKQALELIPSLKELVKNPFLMTLSLEVMPRMIDTGEHLSATHVTKVGLYDHFIEHWLERGKKRIGEKKLNPQSRAAFENLIDEGFTRNGIDFLKKLAVAIYKEQDGQPIVEYSRYKDEQTWKSEFFSRDDEMQLLREACPLTRNGNQYRFIHRSLLEYGLALAVFDPHDWRQSSTSKSSLCRRGSVSSISSFIEYSKVDKKWRMAASNAITILVRVGVEFRYADLKGIQIPGADLSQGVFDSANLQGADLRKVTLSNVWLRGSDLSGVQMKDAQFGELPFLKYDHSGISCMYSPDGSTFTVALLDGNMNVYATSNWEKTWTLSGHGNGVKSIAYSPNGDRIVSGCYDSRVRIWDVATGECLYIFIGHTDSVVGAAFSPKGNVVASRSYDETLRLWDVESGDCRYVASGCGSIFDMAFSPNGDTIAFGSWDCSVRLIDTESGECRCILIGHTRWITSITFSAQGELLISKGWDKVLRAWEVATGTCQHVLRVRGSFVLSPKGNQIASYTGWRKDIRLLDIETGVYVRRLSGHDREVVDVVYSPQGDQIVSGAHDSIVRLWDVETGECRHTMTGHTMAVMMVLFSPKGDHIASVEYDKTVRLWNVGSAA